MKDDWTTVVPAPGDIRATALALLKLAHTPSDVRTDGNGSEFRVPPYLAELYNKPPVRKRAPRKTEEGEE